MKQLITSLKGVVDLVFPNVCSVCEYHYRVPDQEFCIHCIAGFYYTDHFSIHENEFYLKFTARLKIHSAISLIYFSKDDISQKAIHQLKYKGRKEIAHEFGKEFGRKLIPSRHILPDLIIPIPLHKKRAYIRGYNQAEVFAKGISETTGVDVNTNIIRKKRNTKSQTKKSRLERMESVRDSFSILKNKEMKAKHVMIVDDVCTTGATLEACALKLREEFDVQVSFGIIALAR